MTCGSPTAELEGKLLVPNAHRLDAIARLASIGPYRLKRRRAQWLHSVYLDTTDFTLARRGVALRLRRDGRRWEATVKWSGRVRGAIHERPEITVRLPRRPRWPFSLPAGPLQAHLARLVKDRPLGAILVTDITRRRFDVLPARGAATQQPIAELVLDKVALRSPSGSATGPSTALRTHGRKPGRPMSKPPVLSRWKHERRSAHPFASYCEVEIERRRGTAVQVARLTDLLCERFTLTPSPDSKFARGLRLLYGDRMPWKAAAASATPGRSSHRRPRLHR